MCNCNEIDDDDDDKAVEEDEGGQKWPERPFGLGPVENHTLNLEDWVGLVKMEIGGEHTIDNSRL